MGAIEELTRQIRSRGEHRHEDRRRIAVECAVAHCVLPGGHLVSQGTNEITVYVSDLPGIEALVETKMDEVERCTRVYEDAIARFEGNAFDYRGPQSPAAEFYRIHHRGILPLRSVKVLESLPPPEAPDDAKMKALVQGVLEGVLRNLSPQSQPPRKG